MTDRPERAAISADAAFGTEWRELVKVLARPSTDKALVAGGGSATDAGDGSPTVPNLEAYLLQDIDATLARLNTGIEKERKALDDLLVRVRQSAS